MLLYCVQVPIPDDMKATVSARRAELVERVAEVDETVGELFLLEEPVDAETLRGGIRRATLALKFVPVFMGRYIVATVTTQQASLHCDVSVQTSNCPASAADGVPFKLFSLECNPLMSLLHFVLSNPNGTHRARYFEPVVLVICVAAQRCWRQH